MGAVGPKRISSAGAAFAAVLAGVCLAAGSVPARAAETVVLAYGDQAFKPKEYLQLKMKLKAHDPAVDFKTVQLVRVRLLAKSKQGKGRVRLRVGNRYTPWQTVGGSEAAWTSEAGASFRELYFDNPAGGSEGYWRIEVDGHIKVREAGLEITRQLGREV